MSNLTVHTGFWIDHTYGPVHGATITVPVRWGNYLISFLSLLVTWAGSSAWGIFSYVLHHAYARKKEKDVLHLQVQVLLRGYAAALQTILDTCKLHLAWRRRAESVWTRTLTVAFAAFFIWGSFTAAGVLVARVATRNYQTALVLAEPYICGGFGIDLTTLPGSDIFFAKTKNDSKEASIYVGTWYHRDSSVVSPGTVFPYVALPYNVSLAEPCPFGAKTSCRGINDTDGNAMVMDTGPLDSHVYFGINAPESDRVAYRKRVTCSPVSVKNFTSEVKIKPRNNQSYIDVTMGPASGENYTFEWFLASQITAGYEVGYVPS